MSRAVGRAARSGVTLRPLLARAAAFALLSVGLGAAAGVVWWWVVDLPSYSVGPNAAASISERGLTEFFAGDAWFCLIGVVVGLVIGILGWRLFATVGWPVALGIAVLSLLAALVCWWVGYLLGPGPFVPRLAAAKPGDQVPIELTIRAQASLVVWPFAAVTCVLLGSSLGRDEEHPRPALGRGRLVEAKGPVGLKGADPQPGQPGE